MAFLGYRVYARPVGGGPNALHFSGLGGGSATSGSATGLLPGVQYDVTVRAVNDTGDPSSSGEGLPSDPLRISTLPSDRQVLCSAPQAALSSGVYPAGAALSWRLVPPVLAPEQWLVLEFTSFQLECDYDNVTVVNLNSSRVLWSGGCQRQGPLLFEVLGQVEVLLQSDASVQRGGFSLAYSVRSSNNVVRAPLRDLVPVSLSACPCLPGRGTCSG